MPVGFPKKMVQSVFGLCTWGDHRYRTQVVRTACGFRAGGLRISVGSWLREKTIQTLGPSLVLLCLVKYFA